MTGYAIMHATCLVCERPFSFNPNKVPSMRVNGEREPICRHCMDAINDRRASLNLPAHVIDPEAYSPVPEGEL